MSDDERGDPFEDFDAPDDREGDPFETLDPPDGGDSDGDGDPADADAGTPADDPVEPTDQSAWETDAPIPDDGSPVEVDNPGASTDDPFSGMDERDGDPFGAGESVFESVDVESVDADEVWASLGETDTDAGTESGSRYAEVSKHRYCEQCEFFTGPPETRCTNEGTEIIEFLDMETVRLLDCPVVAEQRELGNE